MFGYFLTFVVGVLLAFNIFSFVKHIIKMNKFKVVFTASRRRHINWLVTIPLICVLVLTLVTQLFEPITDTTKNMVSLYIALVMLGYILVRPKIYATEDGIVINYQVVPYSELKFIRFVVPGRLVYFADTYAYYMLNRHELNHTYAYFKSRNDIEIVENQDKLNLDVKKINKK